LFCVAGKSAYPVLSSQVIAVIERIKQDRKMTTVTKAGLSDLNELATLFDAYRRSYGQVADLKRATEYIQQRLENQDTHLFLARKDSKAIGFAHLFPSFSSVYTTRMLILNDLYVRPDNRSQGIGRLLLEELIQFSRQFGSRGLRLETQEQNRVARNMYESLGFVQESGFVHYFLNTP